MLGVASDTKTLTQLRRVTLTQSSSALGVLVLATGVLPHPTAVILTLSLPPLLKVAAVAVLAQLRVVRTLVRVAVTAALEQTLRPGLAAAALAAMLVRAAPGQTATALRALVVPVVVAVVVLNTVVPVVVGVAAGVSGFMAKAATVLVGLKVAHPPGVSKVVVALTDAAVRVA